MTDPYDELERQLLRGLRATAPTGAGQRGADADAPRRGRSARAPRRRSRLAWVGVATLGAVAAAVVALPLLPSPAHDRPLDVVASASAALGERGDIVHFRLRFDNSFQGIPKRAPSACGGASITEVWLATTNGPRYRMVSPAMKPKCGTGYLADGTKIRGEGQFARTPTTVTEYFPELRRVMLTTAVPVTTPDGGLPGIDAPPRYQRGDPVSTLRAMLQGGYLRAAGREVRDGGTVVRLVGASTTTTGKGASRLITKTRLDYLVDARTFDPVQLQTARTIFTFKGNGRPKDSSFDTSSTTTFLTYERIPLTATSERLVEIHPTTPVTTTTTTAADAAAQNEARMKRESAAGHALALRMQAEQKRERRAK